MYLAHFKLKNVRIKVLVIVYHWSVSDDSRLIDDLKEKYLDLSKNEADIKVMTFQQACKGENLLHAIIILMCNIIHLFVWLQTGIWTFKCQQNT